jgi:adenine phosphoribosyltransferase
MTARTLRDSIRSIPDFPKRGIMFRDITTLLKDPRHLHEAAGLLAAHAAGHGITKVAGIESRGFILGGLLADTLQAGFIPIRKPGKLPAEKLRQDYALEYGTDALEIHRDAIAGGDRVLLHDDLLATGGTARAACTLIERLGGTVVSISFLVELTSLHGRDALRGYDVFSLLQFEGE